MASAADPALWQDSNGTTPPSQWEALEADDRWWWYGGSSADPLTYIGSAPLPPVLEFDWEIINPPDEPAEFYLYFYIEGIGDGYVTLGSDVSSGTAEINTTGATPGGEFTWYVGTQYGSGAYYGTIAVLGPDIPPASAFNCVCADERPDRTLAELRVSMLRRLGFSAQATNPPPGMAELLNDFLRDAQNQLYQRYRPLRTERFYVWTMTPGTRFYGIRENEDGDPCNLRLDPYKITWVGVEDLNGTWMPLVCGIPPTLYTNVAQPGIPCRYEVRQCIEVYPAPAEAYKLRVKGHFGLQPFTLDTHQTTVDSEAVFLLALAQAKAHYRQPDAGNYFSQANNYIGSLVAGAHLTRRYVPRSYELDPMTRPRMVSWDDEP